MLIVVERNPDSEEEKNIQKSKQSLRTHSIPYHILLRLVLLVNVQLLPPPPPLPPPWSPPRCSREKTSILAQAIRVPEASWTTILLPTNCPSSPVRPMGMEWSKYSVQTLMPPLKAGSRPCFPDRSPVSHSSGFCGSHFFLSPPSGAGGPRSRWPFAASQPLLVLLPPPPSGGGQGREGMMGWV